MTASITVAGATACGTGTLRASVAHLHRGTVVHAAAFHLSCLLRLLLAFY